ncbi:threonine/serine dehydratase [Amycolatopsis sp. H20-H5]|uniref:threonine/serine dehydratase n=1 Tax=Amycolatopsis sp. H20-H5 TaxID=3046309 RepID=UPI002DB6C6A8|nr:threonine/serine dehydratase [Amycolatopsis sp. H20-H5]MEC3975148.1 threonine/serine dehydratase [Amycolatopsis sp. H20-H5]
MTNPIATPGPADVRAAQAAIRPYARRTPVLRAELGGRPLVLKLEHLQLSGAFKLRGALNSMIGGPRPARVVTASGGNHGLGVAMAAALLGLPATVYVPETVPEAKAVRIEAAGAELIRHGRTYGEAAARALDAAGEPGTRYLHAYDEPLVIAGQGTVGAEIVEDVPEVDAVLVAVGGGGLASGVSLGIGERSVFAVEPEHCRALNAALEAGEPVDVEIDSVASSALGATRVGELPFRLLNSPRVTSVLVSDKELRTAQYLLWDEFRLVVEPAAAVPLAAWLAGRVDASLPCVVLCGANV